MRHLRSHAHTDQPVGASRFKGRLPIRQRCSDRKNSRELKSSSRICFQRIGLRRGRGRRCGRCSGCMGAGCRGDLLWMEQEDGRCSHEDDRAVDGKPEVATAQDHFDAFVLGNLSAEQVSARAHAIRVPMVNAARWVRPARPRARPCSASRSPEVTATV